MHKVPFAEWLLSRAVGPERAAALYGDLEELSANRSRLWFWTAYFRTIVMLGWRTLFAFVIALGGVRLIFGTVAPWLMNHVTHHLSDPGLFGQENLRVSLILWNVSFAIARSLCFFVPFMLFRFGPHNRVTRLAGVLFLVAIPIYSLTPWARDLSSIGTIFGTLAACALPQWRRPLGVVAGTILAAVFFQTAAMHTLVAIYSKNYFLIPASTQALGDKTAFALGAIICVYLSRLLLPERPALA